MWNRKIFYTHNQQQLQVIEECTSTFKIIIN